MRKYIEGLESRAAIIYRIYWLNCSLIFGKGGDRGVDLVLMYRGDSGKKGVTDKIALTAYVVWFITSGKDCRYSSR